MPRAQLFTDTPDTPLSVTAVSVKLGISASTLRTWERRYGLGPGERQAGSHRRYLPEDVARLARMVELIRSGVATSDAAATVIASFPKRHEHYSDVEAPASVAELIEIARDRKHDIVMESLEAAVREHGLVHTWSRLVSPALRLLRSSPEGVLPGAGEISRLKARFVDVLGEVLDHCPPPHVEPAPRVMLLTDRAHSLPMQVIGVALAWYGMDVRMVSSEDVEGFDTRARIGEHIHQRNPDVAILMGAGDACETMLMSLTNEFDLQTVLVGADSPDIVRDRVLRVRTVAACVEEVVALLAPGADTLQAGSHDHP
ncbi:MerR family transcriptional regulator [Schaalia sp. ZJ405]|uniref:MerR family transcriptional regulator n=1 Tax=unclassified Schaalia TaxID=2691889 RepID=UPI0013EAFCCA|nr:MULTISPECIES: MerR family transcriptional regulator [unclassified Schaalia]QPK80920.1 MerR family transcriptional regulator [Schaalia sp. ZJ405]